MPVAASRRRNTRRVSQQTRWVRKNLFIDQRKLEIARRELDAATDTEAVDRALDSIAFRRELGRGIAAVRRAGGIKDVFEER